MRYTAMMLINTTPAWLSLSPEDRALFNEVHINPILTSYADRVRVRLFDAEAFTGHCTDFALFETEDIQAYYFLVEELRDTALFVVPYFVVQDIIVGIEGGFREFEAARGP